jgi:hypothetical protein
MWLWLWCRQVENDCPTQHCAVQYSTREYSTLHHSVEMMIIADTAVQSLVLCLSIYPPSFPSHSSRSTLPTSFLFLIHHIHTLSYSSPFLSLSLHSLLSHYASLILSLLSHLTLLTSPHLVSASWSKQTDERNVWRKPPPSFSFALPFFLSFINLTNFCKCLFVLFVRICKKLRNRSIDFDFIYNAMFLRISNFQVFQYFFRILRAC